MRALRTRCRSVWVSTQWVVAGLALAACGSQVNPDRNSRPLANVAGTGHRVPLAGSAGIAPLPANFGNNPTVTPAPGTNNPVANVQFGCKGLQCQQHECPTGATTISGRVYDPAGKNPLYNIAVFVPNEAPAPIALGASCECEKLYTGKPVVAALTDPQGRFTLMKAPDGPDIPLVIQIGKWRRQFTLPTVTQCADTPVPDKMLRLPRNHKEGDIPNIAISTGAADTLECLLRRVGVDASEYVPGDNADARIHIFQGTRGMSAFGQATDAPNTSPAAPASPIALWNSTAELMKYDIVLLSCEGQETSSMNQQAVHDYASAGGRVFASHFHYAWFNSGPYASENLATWTPGANNMGNIGSTIVTNFPKGQALQQWLTDNRALVNGSLPIQEARHNADVSAANAVSQAWILADQNSRPPGTTEYLSFNTPTTAMIGPDGKDYCGRVVFSDLHVGAASKDDASMPVPTGCSNIDLSPQEKALEFMLFDLSACVIPDDRPPAPPPILM